jgi:chaperonin cofactor prefoldin
MNAPVLASARAESVSADIEPGAALVEQKNPKPLSQIETDAERIRSSIARLTSNSLEGLEGLASELQQLQSFLKSEVERVQGEIETALAGINIIIETIAPWKTGTVPATPSNNARPIRADWLTRLG